MKYTAREYAKLADEFADGTKVKAALCIASRVVEEGFLEKWLAEETYEDERNRAALADSLRAALTEDKP
jgi:gamma-glutamylcysteine synthetase